jgi:hypothetical protein
MHNQDEAHVDANDEIKAQTLLDNLTDTTILHLACHGFQDPSDLLKSGSAMQDEMLTVERLMPLPLPLPRAFLAF